ncbi:hypothetical protein [Halarcobacter anaerophilus]|uniref:Uncharacterized protein n=1 Tax=Halarcobacter anaerophilus TaxID=877500 RepID=A0A4Q0Y4H5_9BACT|nr:hypothetical protein [Halarcobacter anaerophilus]QDF29004.1 hypothetical protein AANAER_1524 [Halarcobacter anaerophilus]RXJ63639.1 hypothetical protein CRV06_05445 [Halarcobacter anaerophilus]
MYSDYKTTTTYFIVIIAFVYAVYMDKPILVNTIIIPMIIMWIILKTNSKELMKDLISVLKDKWSK